MRVLFIGGTGSISTACAHLCVQKGYDLWLLNRGNRKWRMPRNITFVPADINDVEDVREKLAENKWDCVVDWTIMNAVDALRDIKLFTDCTKQFIYISSTAVYQAPALNHKLAEGDETGSSTWSYALGKHLAEVVLQCSRPTGPNDRIPLTVARPGHTYCEFTIPTNITGLGYGLIERMKQGKKIIVHDDGQALRTLTHSSDFAVGLVGLIGREDTIGETFHITSDETLTWLDIFNIYGEALGIKPQLEFIPSSRIYQIDREIGASLLADKALSEVFDNSKIKRFVPDYVPKVNFSDGIKRSLKWHREHKDKIYYNKQADEAVDEILRKCRNVD